MRIVVRLRKLSLSSITHHFMYAKLIRSDAEEGGTIVIEINGQQITGMDNLVYSALAYPAPGEEFAVRFTCMFDEEAMQDKADYSNTDRSAMFNANPLQEQGLRSTGLWSYHASGKLLSLDGENSVALADCGGCLLPIPIEVTDPEYLGQFIAFDISRLNVWHN